jgi:hypothetical protein
MVGVLMREERCGELGRENAELGKPHRGAAPCIELEIQNATRAAVIAHQRTGPS